METSVAVLYTANIQGDLDLLPRLHTFIRQLKSQLLQRRALLLDLGESCAAGVWHCDLTGGRSTLIVLDAMGYDAANVSGFLTAEGRKKLEGKVSVALIDPMHTWQAGDVFITTGTPPVHPDRLHIALTPATSTRLDGGTLHLAAIAAGQVGMAQVASVGGKLTLLAHEVFDLPATTPPDPTIAGTVEFVTSEARYYQEKKGGLRST